MAEFVEVVNEKLPGVVRSVPEQSLRRWRTLGWEPKAEAKRGKRPSGSQSDDKKEQ